MSGSGERRPRRPRASSRWQLIQSTYWKKECKKGLNEERVEKEIITDEESFFKKSKNVSEKSDYLSSFDDSK